jgi:HAD superfamily hydrolase (TIGR01509 family)
MSFALVAFDCDGVLVDTEPVVNRLFLRLVARNGPTLPEAESLIRFTGASMDARIDGVRAQTGWVPPPGLIAEFEALLDEALRTELRVVPGVQAVVRSLRTPRCVVSNGSRHEITTKLALTGLTDLFGPHVFSAMELPRRKPFPDIYLHATSSMGVKPSDAAAIEDSAPGVRAAVEAGLTVFGFAANTDAEELARLGARVFTDMSELPALLALR